jgi:mitochondrial fission protein ELM1
MQDRKRHGSRGRCGAGRGQRVTLRSMTQHSPRISTYSDERAGNRHQAEALAAAMGGRGRHVTLRFPLPWRWLAPRGVAGALGRFPASTDDALPDIAIGCGRQAALALRALRRRGVYTVQILDPRIDPGHYDLVVAPAHDALAGTNVLSTTGALHAIDDAWLIDARRSHAELAALSRPLDVILIGGPHREAALTEAALTALIERCAARSSSAGGSLYVCGSRRTPAPWRPLLRAHALALGAQVWMDADDGSNPYRGLLAHADRLVVSADSVNMLSEACGTGVPVASFGAAPPTGKLLRFKTALDDAGLLCDLDAPRPPRAPLREAAGIAEQVLQRWRQARR